MNKFPKAIAELRDITKGVRKKDIIKGENLAEYNTISDNIGTAGNKDILAFSFDKNIDSKLRELNKCIILKTAFGTDWICEMLGREEPFVSAKLLACLNRSENGMTIKTNDPCLSDFIFAFMRMNNLQSSIDGKIHNKALLEFSPKGLAAEIGIPIGYIKHMHLILDSFAYFLDSTRGFYLLNKRIYTDRNQWEKELGLMVKSMISHLVDNSLDLLPRGVLESVLKKSDRRRRDEIEPIVREALKEIEERKVVQEHREWAAKIGKRKQSTEKLHEKQELQIILRRRTIFDKHPTIHKRRKIGEE